jgi:hypothetical protein
MKVIAQRSGLQVAGKWLRGDTTKNGNYLHVNKTIPPQSTFPRECPELCEWEGVGRQISGCIREMGMKVGMRMVSHSRREPLWRNNC